MTFADLIREYRRRHFLSQTEFGKRVGVTLHTVQRWESGKGLPYPAMQRHLLDLLKIPPEELRAALDATLEELGRVEGKEAA